MPQTQRTPPQAKSSPAMSQPSTVPQNVELAGQVVRIINANDAELKNPQDFQDGFKNKNAHVKRTITRATNVLAPFESKAQSLVHDDDITLLRNHLQKIDQAINGLNEFIDTQSQGMGEEALQPYTQEADAHIPEILDLRARVNHLDRSLRRDPAPSFQAAAGAAKVLKVDNTFRPKPLHKSATPAAFNKWKKAFQIYVRRNGFQTAPADEQRVLLNGCLTPDMEEELERICLPASDASLDDIMDSIYKHLVRSNNLTTQRCDYFNCIQGEHESIREYIVRFRKLGDYASFDNFSYDENMVCRLMTGIRSDALRKELLRQPKSSFDTIQNFALTWEDSDINAGKIVTSSNRSSEPDATVDKVSAYKANRRSNFNSGQGRDSSEQSRSSESQNPRHPGQSCYNCGLQRHAANNCPARDKVCNYCKKTGHFSKVCRKAKNDRRKKSDNQPVQSIQDGSQPDVDDESNNVGNLDFEIFEVDTRIQAPTPKIRVAMFMHNRSLGSYLVVPDTGAAVSVLPSSLARSWNAPPKPLATLNPLRGANGAPLECIGTLCLTLTLNHFTSDVVFFVCDDVQRVLLSWMALKNLGVVSTQFPRQCVSHVQTEVINDQFAIFRNKFIRDFPTVFGNNTSLSEMRGTPMKIHLKDGFDREAIKQVMRPRPVPVPLRNAVRKELMRLVKQGIIRPIEEPTDFVSPLVVVPKKNNTVRLVVDYTQLNTFIKRPRHPFPSVEEVRALIPPTAKCFATLDAVQGYLQIPLHKSSQPLTTFLTPWGRYCFTRAPMGLSSSGDVFCARGDQAFDGIKNIIKVVDDILVFAEDMEGLSKTVGLVLKAAAEHAISLSPDKFRVGEAVDFVGLRIAADSIGPDAKHFAAIEHYPEPSNKTDLRSFLGLVNQFSAFSPNIARLAKPLRPLLSKTSTWIWDSGHREAFNSLRRELIRSSTLHCFSPDRKTKLLTDASRLNGLGYALLQLVDDNWVLISCGSRFITETEANYAVFELEALAIVWAINKCRIFLLGLPSFDVITDHRPLVTIFNSTRLSKSDNPRLLRLLHKVSMYSFRVSWTPGRHHHIPDALSRAPLPEDSPSEVAQVQDDPQVQVHPDAAVVEMAKQASADPKYQDIVHAVKTCHQNDVKKLPPSTHLHVRALLSLWDRLSIDVATGLVLLDAARILVPRSCRQEVIDRVHRAHQGMNRTRARLGALYFWPGMSNQVVQAVQSCSLCQEHRDEQPSQPLTQHPCPPRPFHAVSIDIFEYRRSFFLTYVDRFTGWPSVACFNKSPSTNQVMHALLSIFKDFGIPNRIRHDGATPFVSQEFKDFLRRHHIQDQVSSAYNPQSNGHAEASVKAMKLLVKKCWLQKTFDRQGFAEAILEWRNTPRYPSGLSPAELLYGRKLRTRVPCISYPKLSESAIQNAVKMNYEHMRRNYNAINSSRKSPLPPLSVGDLVRIRNCQNKTWDRTATVIQSRHGGQSYVVEAQGRRFLRNRRLLMKLTH